MRVRKINLGNLPRKNGRIDWNNSIGKNVYFQYNDITGYVKILDYIREDKVGKIVFQYKNKIDKINTSNFKKVQFGNILNIKTNDFKIDIGTYFKDNKRDLIIIDRKYKPNSNGVNIKYYKYKCNKCGYTEGWILESDILTNGNGCGCCASKVVVPGINDIATTDPWMIKYLVDKEDAYKYSKYSDKKIEMKCPDCGRVKLIAISTLYTQGTIGCLCSDGKSYAEKFMFNVFEQLGEKIVTQYNKHHTKWCENYFYDFYSVKFNIIIETHGMQHYDENSNWKISLKEQQKIDKIKKELALSNGIINYIELDCRYSDKKYIKNSIFNSELINYFDFSHIDWNDADRFATKNLVKEVCKYYEMYKKDKILMKDIANTFKISTVTLMTYLKKGNNFNWCKYTPKSKSVKTPIKVVETDDVFNSISECSRQSQKLYNVNLLIGGISKVLNGRTSNYKGFHFEYIKEE